MEYLNGCSKPFEGTRTISGPFPNLFSLVNETNRHTTASGGTDQMLGANRADDGFGFIGRILTVLIRRDVSAADIPRKVVSQRVPLK